MAGHDVQFGSGETAVRLMLYEDSKTAKSIRSTWLPVDPQRGGSGTEDRSWSDWKNGLGYSQPGIVADGYAYGEWIDARSPGLVLPAGALTEVPLPTFPGHSTIVDSFTYNGDYYLLAGRSVLKMASGTGDPEIVHDLGSDGYELTKGAVVDRDGTRVAYLGHGPSAGGFTRLSGTTFTTVTDFYRGFTTPVFWTTTDGKSVRRLVAADSDYSIRHCALTDDPLVPENWSSQIVVGEGAFKVKGIAAATRHAYIVTDGGLYDLNELAETLPLTPYLADLYDVENGLRSLFYDRYVMYAGVNFLDAIDVSQTGMRHAFHSDAMPGQGAGLANETPIWGRPSALCHDVDWLVASFFNNDDSYICYGKPRRKLGWSGPGEWIWHGAFAKLANQQITHMRVKSVTVGGVRSRRLYIATIPENGGTARLYWQSLPRSSTSKQEYDVLAAGAVSVAHRWAPGFTLVNTPQTWDEPNREKTIIRADVASVNLGDGNSLSVTLIADGDPADAPLGAATISPSQPLPVTGNATSGLQVAPQIEATSGTASPAMLRSVTLRGAINREVQELLEMDVLISKDQELGHGGLSHQASPKTTAEQIWALQNTVTTFAGPQQREAEAATVLVEPIPVSVLSQAEGAAQKTERGWARKVTIRCRVLDRPALYGVAAYDTEARYS